MSPTASKNNIQLAGRDFLALADYTPTEIAELLAFAAELKKLKKEGKAHKLLDGKSVALYFEKPSNRTRVSFEVGIFDLGAHPIMLRKEEINLGVRETIADTARTLARYVDGIMIRTFAQKDVVELAEWSSVPVINGLTDDHHPCQVLADLQTVQEQFGNFKGLKLTYVGDGNNMANSLMEGCALVGMDVVIASPSGYQPKPEMVKRASEIAAKQGSTVSVTDDIKAAVSGAHVVYTDVWASMGQEAEAQARKEKFKDYTVSDKLMANAAKNAIVLHCLPAHRGEEITHEVLEKHAQVILTRLKTACMRKKRCWRR